MRYWVVLLFYIFTQCSLIAQDKVSPLATRIDINIKNQPIKVVIQYIESKTNIRFAFNPTKVDLTIRVSIEATEKKVSWILTKVLAKTKIEYQAFDEQVSLIYNPDKQPPRPPQFTISGYLIDEKTQDPLIGATILEPKTYKGTTTNIEGFYSLTLPVGKHQLVCSYIGYQPMAADVEIQKNVTLNFNMNEGAALKEVVVEASEHGESRHELNSVSSHNMSVETIKQLPSLLGEADVVRAMQLLPGVQSGAEGASGLFVRGGGPDQNLFLLDGVPVYNANHLFGFISIFDSEVLKKTSIIKGGFPARYGGRLSSVLEIDTRVGDMNKFHGGFTLGLLSIGGFVEGPIWKGKTSFLVSARRSWADAIAVPIQEAIVDKAGGIGTVINYSFYDVNIKLKHKFSDKNFLVLNGYWGDDLFQHKKNDNVNLNIGPTQLNKSLFDDNLIQWGNRILALHWHSQLSDKLFMKTSATYSNYVYESKTYSFAKMTNDQGDVLKDDIFETEGETPIYDVGARIAFDFIPHNKHYIRFGGGYTYHYFRPEITQSNYVKDTITYSEIESSTQIHESNLFIEDDIRIGKVLKINVGVHLAMFALNNKAYFSPQPRLLVNVLLTKHSSIKASYARMTQFVHLLTNPGIGLPTDLWLPTTQTIPPEHSNQVTLGFTQDFPLNFEMTIEGFYKSMENVLEYNPSTNFLKGERPWERLVEIGKGESYGAELMLQRTKGKFTGWIGYTLAWSWRTFEQINRGDPFPYRYDRRHDISIALNYKLNDQFDFGLTWVYGTGHPITFGTERYTPIQTQMDNYGAIYETYSSGTLASEVTRTPDRNNFRMPPFHHLDLSFNWNKKLKHGSQRLSIGIYNVYNRMNPYMITAEERSDSRIILKQVSIMPIMPSISYSRRW